MHPEEAVIRNAIKAVRLAARAGSLFLQSPKQFARDIGRYVAGGPALAGGDPFAGPSPDTLPRVTPLHLRVEPGLSSRPTLNLVIPWMRMTAMSGGPNTLLQVGYRMAKAGVPVRFVSGDVPADREQEPLWRHLSTLTDIPERLPHVEIVDGCRAEAPAAIGERDVFCASAWWTAHQIRAVLPRCRSQRFMYVIQDFEPGFSAWDSEYALALETYGMNFRAIINHPLLAEYLTASGVGRFAEPGFLESCAILDTAVDHSKFHPSPDLATRTTRRLLFYARPHVGRNLFELGLFALKRAAEAGVFSDGPWELYYMGEPVPPTPLGPDLTIAPAGWLAYDAYAELLRGSDVALSLMLSPHPSYPPLEMAACAGLAVTNTFGVKSERSLREISPNLIPVPATVEGIVGGLREAVRRVGDHAERVRGSRIRAAASWGEAFSDILPRALGMWEDCRRAGG